MSKYTVLSYGGGTNSTAMLVGLLERGERPDVITFADTGGERPDTYQHLEHMRLWCAEVGFPDIVIVRGSQPQQIIDGTLENECLRLGVLPSKAYGYGSCSEKWKIDPQTKFIRKFAQERGVEISDITRLIGFDAGESHRADRANAMGGRDKNGSLQRYPLIEWDWDRDDCIAAIKRAGLPAPGKSSCWFCPSSRKPEILALRQNYPDLLDRALKMEARALAGEGQAPAFRKAGLGRNFSWAEFLKLNDAQQELFCDLGAPEVDCGCYDG